MEDDIPSKWKKKVSTATVISDKIDFKPRWITRDKEGQYIMIKRSMSRRYGNISIYMLPTHEH